MATPKTWTAEDIKMGAIRLKITDGILSAIQGYRFVNDAGDEIAQLPNRTASVNIEFTELPPPIRQALLDINNFMYGTALAQEGME